MDKTAILIWNVGRLYKANNFYKIQLLQIGNAWLHKNPTFKTETAIMRFNV